MTITLDNTGAGLTLRTRRGLDFQYQLGVDDENHQPVDLTGYTAIAQLNDGTIVHDLATAIVGDTVSVHIPSALTATLPAVSHHSVEVVSPAAIRTSLVFGPVYVDEVYP
jgi:hypothetical protein